MTTDAGPDFRVALPLTKQTARLMLRAVDAEFNSQVSPPLGCRRAAQPAEDPDRAKGGGSNHTSQSSMAQNQADE